MTYLVIKHNNKSSVQTKNTYTHIAHIARNMSAKHFNYMEIQATHRHSPMLHK